MNPTSGPTTGDSPPVEITRLAPSPTGALHLGNARTFLVNWLLARQRGWRVILRMEDLDGPRVKQGSDRAAIDVLEWLGLDWDDGPIYQSEDLEPFRAAMRELARLGAAYPCDLTRREIEEASRAPHGRGELRFGPELRPATKPRAFDDDASRGWRFVTPDRAVECQDQFLGALAARPFDDVGDFAIWTKSAQPAYQLAVVVDDYRMGITQIVRGDDLASSTGRQQLLREALGLSPPPTHWHVPLVVGSDGQRLAKRHGDTKLARYRADGVCPERVLGLLADWCGVSGSRRSEIELADLLDRFDIARMPTRSIVFGQEDEAWLEHAR